MKIEEIISRTKALNARFSTKLGKQGRMLDLVEEVGELANAMLEYDGGKEKGDRQGKSKEHVADAISDILYDLILIAEHYEVDMEADYQRMLKEMNKRFDSGEFIEKE